MITSPSFLMYSSLGIVGFLGPIFFPAYTLSIAFLWVMVLMATTWDMLGGQTGYNSLGNITFFGVGMYISAIVQISVFYDAGMAEYTSAMGSIKPEFTDSEYFLGLSLGILAAGFCALLLSLIFSSFMFGLRGPYFAIGSLGLAIAAAEITITIDYVGGAVWHFHAIIPWRYRDPINIFLCFVLCSCRFGSFFNEMDVFNPIWARY